MWSQIELRELGTFVALAEQLHFGRAAQLLGITQSRVSQSLRGLEAKLGTELVRRTSRRVDLTEAGERFRSEMMAPYRALLAVLERTSQTSRRPRGTVRIGVTRIGAGGAALDALITQFEHANPDCRVQLVELPFADRWAPLRRGEIDAMLARLPLNRPGLMVGPVLLSEPRMVALARTHPLARRAEVSIEEVAEHRVVSVTQFMPKELADAFLPARTPGGRRIARAPDRVASLADVLSIVARGTAVHLTVEQAELMKFPGVVFRRVPDLPPLDLALAWRRGDRRPALRQLVQLARKHGR